MDILAWGVDAILLAYVLTYSYKFLSPIFRYQRQSKNGEKMQSCTGHVSALSDAQKKTIGGEAIIISMPIYSYTVGKETKTLQSYVKYRNVNIGDAVTVTYNERTGDTWNLTEFPMMKRQLIARTGIIYLLLIVFTLINLAG
jgi:hypothetical protein